MRTDFTSFESVYALTANRETLLNLARLENHDPTYFFKMGQISSSYRMQGALNGTSSFGANPTGGVTPSIGYESNPAFTFIPVNDDVNAQLLLKPIPPATFYILYQQGWRVDQLFRLMVDRLEFTQNGVEEIIRNAPPDLAHPTKLTVKELRSYVLFLRISAIVYDLQKRGYLVLRGENHFEPNDRDAPLSSSAGEPPAPSAKDMSDALAKDAQWGKVDGKWFLGHEVFNPVFQLNPPCPDDQRPKPEVTLSQFLSSSCIVEKIEKPLLEDMQELAEGDTGLQNQLGEVLFILHKGFSIELSSAPSACPKTAVCAHLVMRSLIGLMADAAQEEISFGNPAFKDTSLSSSHPVYFSALVPPVERLPLLHLRWKPQENVTAPLVELTYRGSPYLVADSESVDAPENHYWNRDMFRLINELSAQVTVDISKFPLPEVLQLRTQ